MKFVLPTAMTDRINAGSEKFGNMLYGKLPFLRPYMLTKPKRMPVTKKILLCTIAGWVAASAIFRIGRRFLAGWLPMPVIVSVAALFLLIAMLYPFYWQWKQKRQQVNNESTTAFWQGITRYFIAIDLSMFGWQKIFHLQGTTPLGVLDLPFSSFSGSQLTWAYYGHSYPFFCVVGALQITGSYLLLFKRTRLFGAVLLFPLLLNIILTDYFYNLELGELMHATILMAGVLYLLLLDYTRLVEFFFKAKSALPDFTFKRKAIKYLIKLSVVAIPLTLIALYGQPDKNPKLTGKYTVKNLIVNHKNLFVNDCRDSLLTTVYMDLNNTVAFEYNSQSRRVLGDYDYTKHSKPFNIVWHYPPTATNSFKGTLLTNSQNEITISGVMGKDTMQVQLTKVKQVIMNY